MITADIINASLVAGIPPALLAFMQLGLGWALVAVAGLVLIDQVIGNYLDPRLQGRTLNISLARGADLGDPLGLDLGRGRARCSRCR